MQKAEVFFRKLVSDSKNGDGVAICSVCSSNELVLEAALEEGIRNNRYVLIEATANQVNQYGGYTGMTPDRYFLWVSALANRIGLAPERLILGGDHLATLKSVCKRIKIGKRLSEYLRFNEGTISLY